MDLENYYRLNFSLMQYHKYSLTEIENMMPWERDIYVGLLKQHLEEEELKQKQQQPPSQQKDLAALVGGVDDPFGVVPAQQQQRKRFLEPTVNVEECVRKLVSQDSGVLYEDTELQIGIKSKWQGSRGRLALYLGNKTEKNIQFSLSVDDIPEVKTQLAPLPQDIGPKMHRPIYEHPMIIP